MLALRRYTHRLHPLDAGLVGIVASADELLPFEAYVMPTSTFIGSPFRTRRRRNQRFRRSEASSGHHSDSRRWMAATMVPAAPASEKAWFGTSSSA